MQASKEFRSTAKDIRQFYVRSDTNQMIPLDNLVSVTQSTAPQVISHYNLFRSAEINGSAAPGLTSREALAEMERSQAEYAARHELRVDWTGAGRDRVGGQALIIFGLGMLVVYLTLSAQYESFTLPLSSCLPFQWRFWALCWRKRCADFITTSIARSGW